MSLARAALLAAVAFGSGAALEAAAAELEPVIVTGNRHEADALSYAGSATGIEAADIRLLGATHHSEIFNRVPGAFFQRNSGQESLTAIRSPVLTGPGSCGSFLFLEDSVPIRPTGFCNVNELFEVDAGEAQRVEILRGPAGAVYGSSAMHGAVNVLQPDPEQMPARGFALETGPDSYYRARLIGALDGDATDFGISALGEYDGGWRADSLVKQQKLVATVTHELGEDLLRLRFSGTNLDQSTAGFIQGFEAYRDPAIAESNANPEAYRKAHALRLNGYWGHALGAGESTLLELRPYLRSSRMEFLQHFLVGKPLEENGQDSGGIIASVRLLPREGTELVFGVDGELAQSSLYEFQANPATDGTPAANAIRPQGRHYDYTVDSFVVAGYAQLQQQLFERLHLTAGLRGEHVEYDYDNHMIAGNTREDGTSCPGGCLYSRPADRTDRFDGFTPNLGLSFALSDDVSVYATAARGYRAPDTSELYRLQRQQSIADLDEERIDNVEIGTRGSHARLSYALALFEMHKDNVILRESNGFNVSNGKTQHRGIEYELTVRALESARLGSLDLGVVGTYAEHIYDFDRVIDGGETIVAGREVDTAPRRVYSVRADYRPIDALAFEIEWMHVADYYLDAGNARTYDGHDLLNLRGSWSFSDSWAFTARVNNLADVAYADRGDFAFGNYRYFPGRERSVFVELRYSLQDRGGG